MSRDAESVAEGRDHSNKDMPAHFYTPKSGTIIYHYTSFEGALAILASDSLWMSDFSKMSDQSEYRYARDCYLHAYQNREFYMDMEARLAATFALLGLEENTVMFIACLSPSDDDSHQWRCYGANGTGCALGIDANLIHDCAGVAMRRVVYDRPTIERFVSAGLHMLQGQFEESPDNRQTLNELARFFVSDLFAFKHPSYAAESEIRISRLLLRDVGADTGCAEVGGHQADGTDLPAARQNAPWPRWTNSIHLAPADVTIRPRDPLSHARGSD
ncbi:MAG TPA: DUF2971 domain-containing protein [Allosphingosinicella sp.]